MRMGSLGIRLGELDLGGGNGDEKQGCDDSAGCEPRGARLARTTEMADQLAGPSCVQRYNIRVRLSFDDEVDKSEPQNKNWQNVRIPDVHSGAGRL
jgi:hypothetical protein